MPKYSFTKGTKVCYDNMNGVIRFVSNEYVTVCVRIFPNERVRDVCLVVYPHDYHLIQIVDESVPPVEVSL